MKKVVKEYPITIVKCANSLQLYRFPVPIKNIKLINAKQKPVSKFVEIYTELPLKNASALKMKTLDTENLSFRAFPVGLHDFSFAVFDGEAITAYNIQNVYLFQPFHFYHAFDYTFTKIRKAESREEMEHRMRSINYQLKNIELEDYVTLSIENSAFVPRQLKEDVVNTEVKEPPFNFKKVEDVIKGARIVNLSNLVDIFKDENAVRSVLFKMTDQVFGRFVLKNKFYDKSLHDMRSRMIGLFRENKDVKVSDLAFLGEERWMAMEVSDLHNGICVLKGSREVIEFDELTARISNLLSIKELLKDTPLLSVEQIADKLSLHEDTILELISTNDDFLHLSNNTFAVNDPQEVLTWIFSMFVNRKSFEMNELMEKLRSCNVEFEDELLIDEIKRYCTSRAARFYLKSIKE